MTVPRPGPGGDGPRDARPPDSLPVVVARAVAAELDCPVEEVPVLYDVVELESLQRLVDRADPDADPVVTFRVEDVRVTVRPDGVETTSG